MYSVIMVDDEKIILDGFSKFIHWKEIGFELKDTFLCAEDALVYLENNHIDIVFTDIEMPRMSGIEFLAEIRKRCIQTEVIALTAHDKFSYAVEMMNHKAIAYILKSSPIDEIEDKLRDIKTELDKMYNQRVNIEEYAEVKYYLKERFILDVLGGIYNIEDVPRLPLRLKYDIYSSRVLMYVYEDALRKSFEGYDTENIYNILYRILETGNSDGEYFVLIIDCAIYILVFYENDFEKNSVIKNISDICGEAKCEISDFDSIYDLKGVYPSTVYVLQHLISDFRSSLLECEYDSAEDAILKIQHYATENEVDIRNIFMDMFKMLVEYDKTIDMDGFWEESFSSLCSTIIKKMRSSHNEERIAEGIIDVIKNYIDENYDKDITLRSVAEKYYINSEYLSRIFKKKVGSNFKNYIIELRMKNAKEMLKHTNASISEISRRVGYRNERYFSIAFKKIFDMTPGEFRNRG